MERTNDFSYLIVLEGQDRTGKDTLMSWIKMKYPNDFIVYKGPSMEEAVKTLYPKEFKNLLVSNTYSVLKQIKALHAVEPNKYIVTDRLWISDNVYSELYGRKPITEDLVKGDLEDAFGGRVITIGLLWKSWNDFAERMMVLRDDAALRQFSIVGFDTIKKLFKKELKKDKTAKTITIESFTTPKDVFEQFEKIICSVF